MKAFLKENLVLVVGISLPVLLALVFLAATHIQQVGTEPPQHKVVFATNYFKQTSYNHYPYRFIVEDDAVVLQYTPQEKNHWQNREPQLFVFDPVTQTSTEIEVPKIKDRENKADITISNTPKGEYVTTEQSPDGFLFEHDYRGGGNLMTEMFGGGYRSRSQRVLRKNGYRMKVPQAERYNTEFIAWVKEDTKQGVAGDE